MYFVKKHAAWLLPLLLMLAITPFMSVLDLKAAHFFYDGGFADNAFTKFMYVYGVAPGIILGVFSGLCFFLSYLPGALKKYRWSFLAIFLTFALGSGFFVHAVLKEYWNRPRPKQVAAFGGGHAFKPYYVPGSSVLKEPLRSMACGHCTMGFVFFSPALAFKRFKKRRAFIFTMFFSLALGFSLGLVRMSQGGHFLSDVLVAGLVMWWSALLFSSLEKQT